MRLQSHRKGEWAALILFFMIVILLMPFALGPDSELLRHLAPGIIWLAALLMSLLALERLFVEDARDGTLDLILLSPVPLPLIVAVRLAAQIGIMLAALAVVTVLAVVMLGMNLTVLPVLALTLLLGIPVLVLLGGIMGAVLLLSALLALLAPTSPFVIAAALRNGQG
jgi:heme exporter protein B